MSKVKHLQDIGKIKLARLFHCGTQWWTRTSFPSALVQCCESLVDFKCQLNWDESIDGQDLTVPWTDRHGMSILIYSVIANNINVVKELLTLYESQKSRLLAWRVPKEGVVEVGIPGQATCLYSAMSFPSPEIVIALLNAGASVYTTDNIGLDPLMAACAAGRLDNVKIWFTRLQWDVNRRSSRFGSPALNVALFVGQRSLNLIKYLVEKKHANIHLRNFSGTSALMNACENVDADPKVVRYLLQKIHSGVNEKVRPCSTKWKILRRMCVFTTRLKLSRSRTIAMLARDSGATAMQFAAQRGDLEIVELLMEYGANPSIKNDLGRDVLWYCETFPQIKGAIERIKREVGRAQGEKVTDRTRETELDGTEGSMNEAKDFTLQRRLSTANPVKYDMYLISLSKMMNLFGTPSERKKNLRLCHQDLLESGELTRFEDLPMGSFVMFISHQWNGFDHPDPNGVHMECMVRIFQRLRDGKIDRVDSDPMHQIIFKESHTTLAREWQQLLSNAYVWYDFLSQPQQRAQDRTWRHLLGLAVDSVGAYVERSDCVVVLVPGTVHKDRKSMRTGRGAYTNYRTYRRRALCVLEMFASFLSRRKTHPMLLIRSPCGIPQWVSSMESQKLAVGECDFTCCERNHEGVFEKCTRISASQTLREMIDKKATFLFQMKNTLFARWTLVQEQWWMRGLIFDSNLSTPIRDLLKWTEADETKSMVTLLM